MERNLNNIAEKGKNHILMYFLDIVSYFVYTFIKTFFFLLMLRFVTYFITSIITTFLVLTINLKKKKPIPFIIKISKIWLVGFFDCFYFAFFVFVFFYFNLLFFGSKMPLTKRVQKKTSVCNLHVRSLFIKYEKNREGLDFFNN